MEAVGTVLNNRLGDLVEPPLFLAGQHDLVGPVHLDVEAIVINTRHLAELLSQNHGVRVISTESD
mgnify:CR=1 FL=1